VKRLALLILLILPHFALAQTEVAGSQSGLWTLSGSPYEVIGELVVAAGQTLTIEPGVDVNFQGHYKFTVNGKLEALGAEGAMIRFTTDNPAVGWGGIRISSSQISELSWCRIEYGKTGGSYPDIHGGGLALLSSDAVLTNCTFADNDATGDDLGMGGAIYAYNTGGGSEPRTRFIDCSFIDNHCYGEGGAIKFSGDTNSEIRGCEFIGNDCNYGGGAISFYGVSGTKVIGCLFADNYTMYSNGGAMSTLGYGNTIYIVGCTITGNSAVTGDGGAIDLAYADSYFVNSIVYDNPGMYSDDIYLDFGGYADIHYCDLSLPYGATGSNNIDEDPFFADAPGGDYHLSEGSPCIDAGTDYIVLNGQVLVDLDPGEYEGEAPDMGAFEYGPDTGVADSWPAGLELYPNYPNPFAETTSIRYRLAVEHEVSIEIYDVAGRKVRNLLSSPEGSGGRSVIWNGRNDAGRRVSPGIYFVRLKAGAKLRSQRILLAR